MAKVTSKKEALAKRGVKTQQTKPTGACNGLGCASDDIKQKAMGLCGACYSHELRWQGRTSAEKKARAKQVHRLEARFTKYYEA